jgi:hypothetical protein
MNFKFNAMWALAIFGALTFPSPAFACRILSPTSEQLAGLDTVLLVTVTSTGRRENPGWNTWDVSSQLRKVLVGFPRQSKVNFAVTLSSDGCGGTKPPKKGEKWVIYLGFIDGESVQEAYPLSLVAELDERLKDFR